MSDSTDTSADTSTASAPVPAVPASGPVAAAPAPVTATPAPVPATPAVTAPADAPAPAAASTVVETTAPVGAPATPAATGVATVATSAAPTSLVEKLDDAARAVREEALGIAAMPGELKDYILHVLDNGSSVAVDFVHHLLGYLKHMAPTTPQTSASGAAHQEAFYRELLSALDNHVGEDFHAMMNCILAIIHWSKTTGGAFASNLWARFLPEWRLGEAEFKKFLNLGQLFRTASDGSTRKLALKQVDLAKALDGLLPATRARLENFFRA